MQQHLQVCALTVYERLFDDVIDLVFDLVVDVGLFKGFVHLVLKSHGRLSFQIAATAALSDVIILSFSETGN